MGRKKKRKKLIKIKIVAVQNRQAPQNYAKVQCGIWCCNNMKWIQLFQEKIYIKQKQSSARPA